jgi:uncharacterized protein
VLTQGSEFSANLIGFGRALRRAGVMVDSQRLALAQEATLAVGVGEKDDLRAALECTLINQPADRAVFLELFDVYFRTPDLVGQLYSTVPLEASARAMPSAQRQRISEAMSPLKGGKPSARANHGPTINDLALGASEQHRLNRADFRHMTADEYALVQNLAKRLKFRLPTYPTRRTHLASHGSQPDWPSYFREVAQFGTDALPRLARHRRDMPLPMVMLIDVSGSMERYARMMLSFLHASTAGHSQRSIFAFGTSLSDLNPAFKYTESDAMLAQASKAISDFAGGTSLAASLATLRRNHAKSLFGGRSIVLLVSDGLDTGEAPALASELAWLKRHCGRLLWLNPLLTTRTTCWPFIISKA